MRPIEQRDREVSRLLSQGSLEFALRRATVGQEERYSGEPECYETLIFAVPIRVDRQLRVAFGQKQTLPLRVMGAG